MCNIVEFEPEYQEKVLEFLEKCLPESGRTFDLSRNITEEAWEGSF